MEIQLLGPPAVRDGPAQRKVAGRQGALLAVLALHARQPVSIDRLADVVWGDEPPGETANALQQRVSRLRGIVDPAGGGDVLVQAGGGYALWFDDDQIDARRFEQLTATGRRQLADGNTRAAETTLSQALRLWCGPVLDGFADELWALGECRRLEELRLTAVEARAEAIVRQGDHERAVAELVDLAATHPLREQLRGQLMLALYGAGRQADALAIYDETRRMLAEELGVDPGPQLQTIHHRVLTQDDGLSAGPPQAPAQAPVQGNLPAPRSSVVGRDHALEQIAQLLSHTRLLTVTGPGGAGKTTLALEAARGGVAPADGTWLVELAPVATGEAVVTTIADALGVTGGGLGTAGIDDDALLRTLGDKHALLLLDNCEHLLDTISPLVERVLTTAAHVQVLATSREPLGLPGEMVWSVPGLGVPDEGHITADQVMAAPAVTLLVERARAHTPAFALSDDTAPAAATLVRRLDGIPLAIELAAARLRVLSLTEVTDALDDRFRLLTGRGRTVASRQRTLRATLDWSWDLLDEPLRRAWAALAVPADRFDLAMATALLAAADVDAEGLDVVADLVDRSLLSVDTTTNPARYRMLESLRDYGHERLAEQGLVDVVHAAHADAVEAALAGCHPEPSAVRFGVDIEGMAAWLDDARVALRWAHENGDRPRAQRIAGLLGWLWLLRGRSAEGVAWLDRGLPAPEDVDIAVDDPAALLWASALRAAGMRAPDGLRWADPAVRAAVTPVDRILAQVCAAGHYANGGRLEEATATLRDCAPAARTLGGWPLGFVRLIGGQLAWITGDLDRARSQTEQAVALLAAAGAEWAQVHALETLIDEAAVRGDYLRARDLARDGLRLCRRQHYPELEAAMLAQLGLATGELGEQEHAAQLLAAAVNRAASVGSASALIDAHTRAGAAARHRGDLQAAGEHLRAALELLTEGHAVLETVQVHMELALTAMYGEQPHAATASADDALTLAWQLGDPRTLVRCVEALAGVLTLTDDLDRAVPLLATADAVRVAGAIPTPPPERRDLEWITDRLRARIGDATFEERWSTARRRADDKPYEILTQLVAAHVGGLRD